MSIKQRRKLVRRDVLNKITEQHEQGVPVARLLRDNLLNISLPLLIKLIAINKAPSDIAKKSLFPEWLKSDGAHVQSQPWDYCRYVGRFPTGEWHYISGGEE